VTDGFIIVSVGLPNWLSAILADEAVFMPALFVIPGVAIFFQQIEA